MTEPKMTDVAKLAGVSLSTVSRVIHRRGYLSEVTIQKVEAAMDMLHYRPNIIAQQLQSQKTMTVGILVPTTANPFFGELAYRLERHLFEAGFRVLIGNAEDDEQKERAYLKQLLAHQVDGLIVATHNHESKIPEYHHAHLPIVSIDRYLRDNIPNVCCDNYAGGRLATEELLHRGAKHIIHTDSLEIFDEHDYLRNRAYEDVMREHGLEPITYQIGFEETDADKRRLFSMLFKEHPEVDAIFASNDTDAILIAEIAYQLGYRLPDDLQLIGFDGMPTTLMMRPDLATIVQPIELMSTTAVAALQQLMDGEPVAPLRPLPVTIRAGRTLRPYPCK